jgi:hypothetical protein
MLDKLLEWLGYRCYVITWEVCHRHTDLVLQSGVAVVRAWSEDRAFDIASELAEPYRAERDAYTSLELLPIEKPLDAGA